MTATELDAKVDAMKIVRLLERMGDVGVTYRSPWQWLERLIDTGIEAMEHLHAFDLSWRPDWADEEPNSYQMLIEAFGILLNHAHHETYQDVIGLVYMEVNSKSARSGANQFFTPYHIAKSMAEMTLGNADLSEYSAAKPMRIMDPAVGSGVMLLAAASSLPRSMIESGAVEFHGYDIDASCVAMCRLNLALYGLNVSPSLALAVRLGDYLNTVIDADGTDGEDLIFTEQGSLFALEGAA